MSDEEKPLSNFAKGCELARQTHIHMSELAFWDPDVKLVDVLKHVDTLDTEKQAWFHLTLYKDTPEYIWLRWKLGMTEVKEYE